MTYEWEDSDGVQHVTAWSKAVRNAMLRGGAEYQRQRVLDRAGTNWNKNFLISAYVGKASAGVQSDLRVAAATGSELHEICLWASVQTPLTVAGQTLGPGTATAKEAASGLLAIGYARLNHNWLRQMSGIFGWSNPS